MIVKLSFAFILLKAVFIFMNKFYKQRKRKMKIYSLLLWKNSVVFSFGSVLMDQRPPALMIFSQAFQACILPAVAIPIFLLINKKSLMQSHRPNLIENISIMKSKIYQIFPILNSTPPDISLEILIIIFQYVKKQK